MRAFAPRRSLALARELPLGSLEPAEAGFVRVRVRHDRAVGQRGELLDAEVDADRRSAPNGGRDATRPLDRKRGVLSCNLLVDSGIQGLATDMLCPDTHLPTPAD